MGHFVLVADEAGVREVASGGEIDPGQGFVWEHLDLSDGGDEQLAARTDIPPIARNALMARETRPRCDQLGENALINLRGPAGDEASDGDMLVSIRAWTCSHRVVSASQRPLAAAHVVAEAMRAGQLKDPGDLVAALAEAISTAMDPEVADLGDRIDDCETEIQAEDIYHMRRVIAEGRSQAIALRRFVAPDRDALLSLAQMPVDWLSDEDRLHIREAADRFARMAEELEAIRERSALLHEQITDLRAEMIDQRSLTIAAVAFVFLPLTFITGLLGMNVTGIPYAREPWAFWGVTGLCMAIGIAVFAWFARRHWLRR